MSIGDKIYKIRMEKHLSQEKFASLFDVSRQSVQKWESGNASPELSKLVEISKYFGISLDSLVLDRDSRFVEEMMQDKCIKPDYSLISDSEFYPSGIMTEYTQSLEQGLDIEKYEGLFKEIANLPKNEIKKKLGDVIFDIVSTAPQRVDYKYIEPSDYEGICSVCKKDYPQRAVDKSTLYNKIYGAWMGRVCGCMLGKTVEGIHTDELYDFLKATDNFPMHRYIYKTDAKEELCKKYKFDLLHRPYADSIDAMPSDDDTNYTVLGYLIVKDYGRDFTPVDVSHSWLKYQPKDAYWTAERRAFCNFIKGYIPPMSAVYQNPYREWIGAQIRADYYGYINAGNPQAAAKMAWKDASVSHIKNGIYGEMFVSAMLAQAAVTSDINEIIKAGLSEIPYTSRLYEGVCEVLTMNENGMSGEEIIAEIHKKYNECSSHDWCHTISNAMIVVTALVSCGSDFGKSICLAVQAGFDTDCNGATVGSVLGMANGIESIDDYWKKPFNDTLTTTICGLGRVKISEMAKKTMEHLAI